MPVHRFVKDALSRKYGEEWFNLLETAARNLKIEKEDRLQVKFENCSFLFSANYKFHIFIPHFFTSQKSCFTAKFFIQFARGYFTKWYQGIFALLSDFLWLGSI